MTHPDPPSIPVGQMGGSSVGHREPALFEPALFSDVLSGASRSVHDSCTQHYCKCTEPSNRVGGCAVSGV